jgi:hypothetical protein
MNRPETEPNQSPGQTALDLKNAATQFRDQGMLDDRQIQALDFDRLARFWHTEIGQWIAVHNQFVHRELPFTARFSKSELCEMGILPEGGAGEDDFVVVQGVVDLAVILKDEIRILDHKTDHFPVRAMKQKIADYAPQLQLYAKALERIYRREVTSASLHFISLGKTAEVLDRDYYRRREVFGHAHLSQQFVLSQYQLNCYGGCNCPTSQNIPPPAPPARPCTVLETSDQTTCADRWTAECRPFETTSFRSPNLVPASPIAGGSDFPSARRHGPNPSWHNTPSGSSGIVPGLHHHERPPPDDRRDSSHDISLLDTQSVPAAPWRQGAPCSVNSAFRD